MQRYFTLIAFLCLSLTITSCAPSRQQADKKLETACKNSIIALSDSTDQIEFLKSSFKSGKGYDGVSLRTVTFDAHFIHDHGVMAEKNYTCNYKEQWSMFGYMPEFYNMEKDGAQYGNFDGHLMGDFNDILKINGAVEKALY